jgi:ectoine hydroxylase-related dioxygenase (phytanoyl-CoA dioxygenase family)
MANSLPQEEVDRFHREGFLKLPDMSTPQEVTRLRDLYDDLFARKAGWERGDFFDFAGQDDSSQVAALPQLNNPSEYEPRLRDTVFRTNAQAIARQLLGPTAELVFEHAMLKPARIGGETPWHQDQAFYPRFTDYQSITFWMPLQPVDDANGCLNFIPRSHLGPLLDHRNLNGDPRIHGLEALGVDPTTRVSCPLPEGHATVHAYRTLHQAAPNTTGAPRRAYALGFGVHSRDYFQRIEYPWNMDRATARHARAEQHMSWMGRNIRRLKNTVKSVVR